MQLRCRFTPHDVKLVPYMLACNKDAHIDLTSSTLRTGSSISSLVPAFLASPTVSLDQVLASLKQTW